MPTVIFQILLAVLIVSLISFVGTFVFFSRKIVGKYLFYAVSFAAGSMIGAAFLDLLPETVNAGFDKNAAFIIILGIFSFFVLEKFLHWHHHHTGRKDVHAYNYLNTIGDAVHNFIDGAIIAISFVHSTSVGIVATIAIIAHEIPQEIGDFAVLLHGGWSKMKASMINFMTALTSFLGALLAYFYSGFASYSTNFMTAFAIGGFIYIAGTDLIPEIHKEKNLKRSFVQFMFMVFGVLVIWVVGSVFEGH